MGAYFVCQCPMCLHLFMKSCYVFVFEKMDKVIDDIFSLQSSYDDIQAYIDPVVQMPNTVSTNHCSLSFSLCRLRIK